ncbi:hypothetical protein [Cohnella sp.]|uniref:hypothetical protein n=1 Tax=Cohnella sp. TaxID=1883426 RepID=UPI003703D517
MSEIEKTSDELNEELKTVVRALELDGLSPEQRARGWKRYDELQAMLQGTYRSEAETHIEIIRETLLSKGAKPRNKKGGAGIGIPVKRSASRSS